MANNITKALLAGKLMFPSDYIAAIECRGRDVTLTIKGVKIDQMQMQGSSKKQPKPVLEFIETKKKLALNKTNAGAIADMYGPIAEKWAGNKITIYPTTTNFGRDTVECIRIREKARQQQGPLPDGITADPEPHEDGDYETSPFSDAQPDDAVVGATQPAIVATNVPPVQAAGSVISDEEKRAVLAKEAGEAKRSR